MEKQTRNSSNRDLIEAYQKSQMTNSDMQSMTLTEKLEKKKYSKWIGSILNSAVRDLDQVRRDMRYHATGSGSDSHTPEEREQLKSAIREVEGLVRDLGSLYKTAGKMKESNEDD